MFRLISYEIINLSMFTIVTLTNMILSFSINVDSKSMTQFVIELIINFIMLTSTAIKFLILLNVVKFEECNTIQNSNNISYRLWSIKGLCISSVITDFITIILSLYAVLYNGNESIILTNLYASIIVVCVFTIIMTTRRYMIAKLHNYAIL